MSRPMQNIDDGAIDPYDDPDKNVGDFVYARKMETALKTEEAPPVLLFFLNTVLNTGPLWIEGEWHQDDDAKGAASNTGWKTAIGFIGEPIAWAPLPKNKED